MQLLRNLALTLTMFAIPIAPAVDEPGNPAKPVDSQETKAKDKQTEKDSAARQKAEKKREAEEKEPHPKPKPITPPKQEDIDKSIRRGIDFLLKVQNKDGSWGSVQNTKGLNIYAPIPGAHHAFRTAVTAMSISAMLESRDPRPEVKTAVDKGEKWLFEHLPHLRRATPDAIYNVWGHAYSIQALVRLYKREPNDEKHKEEIKKLIVEQIALLSRYESVDGGWGYYDMKAHAAHATTDSTSFVNAAVLYAMFEAQQLDVKLPAKIVSRAIAGTTRQRKPDFSYLYGEYLKWKPMMPINRPGGSLGRSQACNVALRVFGDTRVTDDVLKTWLDRLYARNDWLGIGRKRPVPHESWFQVAGYFYYFGHYYAGLCIEQLKLQERPYFQDHLAHILLPLQEKDGSWWDYPFYNYHQQYGTAFAVMTLVRCKH